MYSELVSPTLNALLRSPKTLDMVRDLIGPDISLFHCKILPKSKGFRCGSALASGLCVLAAGHQPAPDGQLHAGH